MSWNELHITTSAEHANELSDQLVWLGAEAVTLKDAGDQPIYEPTPETPRVWQETIVIGLFGADFPLEEVIRFVETQQALGVLQHFHLEYLPDEDWERRCLDSFKPLCFGQRLWICPSWQTPPDPNAVNVILDPGLAFGTGTHATTSLCLEWLDQNIHNQELVIDYGCGSGILAIAAIKLGAKQALAIDNDPQALQATNANSDRNFIHSPQLITQLADEPMTQQADVLVANILAQPLIFLAPKLASLVKMDGKIALSGILRDQVDAVLAAYEPWFKMQPPVFKEDWVRLEGQYQKKTSVKR